MLSTTSFKAVELLLMTLTVRALPEELFFVSFLFFCQFLHIEQVRWRKPERAPLERFVFSLFIINEIELLLTSVPPLFFD
ncbi:hypothetical protein DL95DRAFT_174330 [Leptodontidium sp. 2 PMI_412]|nr:hypothetical protein DL95DRAFT_174330 [Leptodontidium sp. 2 PMI_412]